MADFTFVEDTGIVIADTEQVLEDVEGEYKAVFGDDLITDPSTPQGVLIASDTNSRQSVIRNTALTANQFNPNVSGGIFLDALWALLGGGRFEAERSVVTTQLTGVAFTTVPAGSLAETTGGDQFSLVVTTQLDVTGNAEAQFQSVEAGAIPAPINSLTQIITGVLGWETIDNSAGATVGRLEESDEAARRRRRQTLALQGQTMPEAISSAVSDVEGVRSLAFLENVTSSPVVIDTINLVAHSIYVCVDGGTDLDVATAILARKSGGCDFNGSTVVNVTDPTTTQVYPVAFERPTDIPVLSRITIRANTSLVDPVQSVKDAILAYANGELEDEDGFVVGGDVSPFELAGAINSQNPSIFVLLSEVSYAAPVSYVTTVLPIEKDELASIVESSITVIIV